MDPAILQHVALLQNKKRKAEHPVFCMNFVRTPQHTSVLSGRAWMEELLTGHPKRMRDNMGISQTGFQYLKKLLIEKGGLQRPIYRFHRTAWDILSICSDIGSFYEEVGGTISKKHRNNPSSIPPCPPVLHLEASLHILDQVCHQLYASNSKIEYSWQYNPYFNDCIHLEPWTVLTFLFPLRTIKEKSGEIEMATSTERSGYLQFRYGVYRPAVWMVREHSGFNIMD